MHGSNGGQDAQLSRTQVGASWQHELTLAHVASHLAHILPGLCRASDLYKHRVMTSHKLRILNLHNGVGALWHRTACRRTV